MARKTSAAVGTVEEAVAEAVANAPAKGVEAGAATATVPEPAPRLLYVDGLRGVAVAMVVVFHAAVWAGLPMEGMGQYFLFDGAVPIELGRLRHILSVGGAGVDLFLAISGFCLFWPLVRDGGPRARPLGVGSYLKRRTRRIYPPYLAGLALVFAVSYLTFRFEGPAWWPWRGGSFQNAFPWQGTDSAFNLASHLLLAHGFFNSYVNAYEGAYWSLSTEWQFYFLFIPLALVAHRVGVLWAVLIPILFTIAFRWATGTFYPQFLATPVGVLLSLSRWVEFGGGMVAAALVSGSLPPRLGEIFAPLQRLSGFFVTVVVALALVLGYTEAAPHLMPYVWAAAGAALLAGAWGERSWMGRALRWRPLVSLGTISYSLYLTHGAVYMAMALLLSRTGISRDVRQSIYLVAGPALATAFAAIFFRVFERPFLSRAALPGGSSVSPRQRESRKAAVVHDQAAP